MYTKLAEIPVPIGAQFTTFSGQFPGIISTVGNWFIAAYF